MTIVKSDDLFASRVKNSTSERRIQEQLYRYLLRKSHHEMAPNISLYEWESDMVSLTKAGYVHEYEIKISRSDFKADAQKYTKHIVLEQGSRSLRDQELKLQKHDLLCNTNWMSKSKLTADNRMAMSRPNYFWYVCPTGMLKDTEVPAYAGLIHMGNSDWYAATVIKQAPKLHREPITSAQTMSILMTLQYRYWRLRMNRPDGDVSLIPPESTLSEPLDADLD